MSDNLQIYPDEVRGHIAYIQPNDIEDRSARRDLYGTDLGTCLHFGGGWLMLTPDQARRVAESLHWWADRHPEPVVELPEGQAELPIGESA